MAISREKKVELTQVARDALTNSKLTVLTNYQGLSVQQMQALRKELLASGSDIKIIKNNLVKRALGEVEHLSSLDPGLFSGPLALIFGYEDEVAPAQVAERFAKEHEALEILGGFNAQAEIFDGDQIKALASLPSKDDLRAQTVATIAAPLSGFVTVLDGGIRGLVQALGAIAESKGST